MVFCASVINSHKYDVVKIMSIVFKGKKTKSNTFLQYCAPNPSALHWRRSFTYSYFQMWNCGTLFKFSCVVYVVARGNHQYLGKGGVWPAHYHESRAPFCVISARESRRHSTQTIMVATGTGLGIRASFVSFVDATVFYFASAAFSSVQY